MHASHTYDNRVDLLDEDYAERADFGFGSYRYFVGQLRGAYLETTYQFGMPRA